LIGSKKQRATMSSSTSPPSPRKPANKRQKTASLPESSLTLARNAIAAAQKELEEREKAVNMQEQRLEEAKKAAPALFAQPCDLFELRQVPHSDNNEDFVVKYLGRNETPPFTIQGDYDNDATTAEIGWLMFCTYYTGSYSFSFARDYLDAREYYNADKQKVEDMFLPVGVEFCSPMKTSLKTNKCLVVNQESEQLLEHQP
jgi:hypothetical protein